MSQVLAKVNCGMKGFYKIRRVKKTGEVVQELEFSNLILNAGLDRCFSLASGAVINTFAVGSSNIAPTVTDVALFSPVARTSITGYIFTGSGNVPEPWGQTRYYARFDAGVAAGNLSEIAVGIITGAAAKNVLAFSRALIVDALGNPTTITVLSDEYLDVYYYLRVYVPTGDITGTVSSGTTLHDFVLRAANAGDFTNWHGESWTGGRIPSLPSNGITLTEVRGPGAVLGDIYNKPVGGATTSTVNYVAGTMVRGTYISGTYTNTRSWRYQLGSANIAGGIATLLFGMGYTRTSSSGLGDARDQFQISFNPPIPKTSSDVMDISLSVSLFRLP